MYIIHMIKKTITVKEYHANYIRNSSLNLSRFVQNRIDELIKKEVDNNGDKKIRASES